MVPVACLMIDVIIDHIFRSKYRCKFLLFTAFISLRAGTMQLSFHYDVEGNEKRDYLNFSSYF